MLWMARALELVPNEAAELERAIRLSLGAWSREAVRLQAAMDAPGLPYELAYSDDGRRLLIASSDGTRLHVQVLDTDNLQILQEFTHDAELISEVMATRDLSRLLVGYTSGACRLKRAKSVGT
jgi:hypothetical protein